MTRNEEIPYDTRAREERAARFARRQGDDCGYGIWKDPSRPIPVLRFKDGSERFVGESRMRGARSVPAQMCDMNLIEVIPCHSQDQAEAVMDGKEGGHLQPFWPTSRDSLNVRQRESRGYDPVEALRHKRAQAHEADEAAARN